MKRFLSIILAIAMIATMLPNVFAADTFEGYKYVFTKAAFESSGSVQRNTLAVMTLETPKPSISDKWKVAGSNCLYNVYAQTEGILWNAYTSRAEGNCVGSFDIEISVPNGGIYKPSLRYSAIKSAPIVDIYLVKEGTTARNYSTADVQFAASGNDFASTWDFITALDDDFKLGQVDLWGDSESFTNIATENFDNLELELDGNSKYYLLFRTVHKIHCYTIVTLL